MTHRLPVIPAPGISGTSGLFRHLHTHSHTYTHMHIPTHTHIPAHRHILIDIVKF